MANPLDSSQFVRLLDKALTEVMVNEYEDLSPMIDTIYARKSGEKAWEEYFGVGAVPDIPQFTGQLEYLPQYPTFWTKIEHAEYAAGQQFERKLIDDEQYGVMMDRAAGLMQAAMRTQEKLAARPFTYAFSSAFDFMTSEEGVALCSDSHASKSGASTTTGFDNAGTTAISNTAIQAARLAMRRFKNDIGERIGMSDNFALIVPDALADTAREIVGTDRGFAAANTSANKINVDYGRYKVIPWMRLDDSDTNNWFLVNLDIMKRNLLWIDRIKPEPKNTVDYETYKLKNAVYFRCANGFTDWRWIYGSNVT